VSYETKWKQTEIKSFRPSPSLLAMIQSECRRGIGIGNVRRFGVEIDLKKTGGVHGRSADFRVKRLRRPRRLVVTADLH
jgi:hypothetical protein